MPRYLILILMLTLFAAALSNTTPSLAQDGDKPKKTAEERKAEQEARDKAFADQLANAKLTLSEGIAKAETATGGKAVMAAYKPGKKDTLVIHVMVLTEAGKKNVMVDAMTGDVAQPGQKPEKPAKKADAPKPKKNNKKADKDDDQGGDDEGAGGDDEM